MIMKFLSNSPVVHVAANTHPAVPTPAVTTITANHHFAINKWNNAYIRMFSHLLQNVNIMIIMIYIKLISTYICMSVL